MQEERKADLFAIVTAALAPGMALLSYFYLRNHYSTSTNGLVFRTFLIGVLLVFPVMVLQYAFSIEGYFTEPFTRAFILYAFVEEFFKWFLLWAFAYQHANFSRRYDGIVYGVSLSLGFATVENVFYLIANGLETAFGRALLPVSSHALYGVIMGYYLGRAKVETENDEIHTAKNVTKTHSSNIATFQSPQYGPIGIVTKRGVFFHHTLSVRECHPVQKLTKKVVLLKTYAGMDHTIVEAVANMKIDGLVIEAFGQGNVPPLVMEALTKLIEANIPVVLVSRCFNGVVQDTYAYEGGGRLLKEKGVIFTNGLNGQKARLKLMVVLEQTTDRSILQEWFYK